MIRSKSNTFHCFSPEVMIATFVIELGLVVFTLVKKSRSSLKHQLIVVILLLLATFQLSEYGVCEDLVLSKEVWARIGFAAITFLPVVGLHLIQLIKRDVSREVSYTGYVLATVFSLIFIFGNSFDAIECGGNYAIFNIRDGLGGMYFVYYYLLLILGAVIALSGYAQLRLSDKKSATALVLMVVGYASFVVPATLIHFLVDGAKDGLPSIMCGFALVFAVLLATSVSNRIDE